MGIGVAEVAFGATVTALATGLGALPFLVRPTISLRGQGRANAVAAGVMVGASLGLLVEGADWSVDRTLVGALAGVAFVLAVQRMLPTSETAHLGALTGASATKALLIITVMTAHSVAEGVGVGVAYGGGDTLGITTTVAIAIHNIPEGLAIALIMVPAGARVVTAAGWAVVSSLPQPVLAVPAFLLVDSFVAVLPLGLGFAAGAMVWMAASELVPDAIAGTGRATTWGVGSTACVATVGLQLVVVA